ncbi:RING-H2 finger protein ATL47 [Hibiscus syriacus]|uniref:RING-type E3 ubiquitin transferase n=1 Tax=Hibiscus syriacus TaxID=106335 RepID=A0A6A2Z8M6_HIBSY|nr:RING-H2 finger protein ATL47 [Hibiscus syriacus]
MSSSFSSPPLPLSNDYRKQSNPVPSSSSASKISPAVLFIIVVLAVIFFISGLVQLLVRFIMKHRSPSSLSESDRYPEMSGTDAYQRQLQQLFHLHDSGLDQSFIDALPVFLYKEITGLKEPFDCAVCLCEFLEEDKLRLLPLCSHAFHIDCIDTWLMSNSTCPLCRGTIFTPELPIENPVFDFEYPREETVLSSNDIGKRVFSVALCLSRGSNGTANSVKLVKGRGGQNGNSSNDGDFEGKKINLTSKVKASLFPRSGNGQGRVNSQVLQIP